LCINEKKNIGWTLISLNNIRHRFFILIQLHRYLLVYRNVIITIYTAFLILFIKYCAARSHKPLNYLWWHRYLWRYTMYGIIHLRSRFIFSYKIMMKIINPAEITRVFKCSQLLHIFYRYYSFIILLFTVSAVLESL